MPLPKLKNLFVSETCLRFCAIDLGISFLALAIASKKDPKPSVVAIWRSQWNSGFSIEQMYTGTTLLYSTKDKMCNNLLKWHHNNKRLLLLKWHQDSNPNPFKYQLSAITISPLNFDITFTSKCYLIYPESTKMDANLVVANFIQCSSIWTCFLSTL